MASNETIAEIVSDMRVYAKNSKVNGGEVDVWNWLANYADRIEAAAKREREAGMAQRGRGQDGVLRVVTRNI